ncbi:MAG TPA: hypothetical protein VNG93_11785 [Candidatus Dormibacteraeota bacterium]|nr:hypothetical protein [Candidatus Dormibacteraeota bacterium]
MAAKTRPKNATRPSGSKQGRRPQVKPTRGRDIPLLPIAVGGILLALVIGLIVYVLANNKPTPGPTPVAGIPCDSLEHTQVHYHAGLQIMYQGNVVDLPDNIGIMTNSSGSASCFYWLHVHANDKNIIHVESPASQTFTLGQFIAVWASWAKLNGDPVPSLDSTHVTTIALTPGQALATYIDLQDGKGPQLFTGDPNSIVLKSHEVITLEITPPLVSTPPALTFPSGE